MAQEAPKNSNDKMRVLKNSLPSHALVLTCWAEEMSDSNSPLPSLQLKLLILSGFVRKIPPTGSS